MSICFPLVHIFYFVAQTLPAFTVMAEVLKQLIVPSKMHFQGFFCVKKRGHKVK